MKLVIFYIGLIAILGGCARELEELVRDGTTSTNVINGDLNSVSKLKGVKVSSGANVLTGSQVTGHISLSVSQRVLSGSAVTATININ